MEIKLRKKLSIENITKNIGAFQWLLLNMTGFVVVTPITYFIFWSIFAYLLEIDLNILAAFAIFFAIPGFIGLICLLILRKGLLKIFTRDKSEWNLFRYPTIKKLLFWILLVVYIIPILFLAAFATYLVGVTLFAEITWYIQNR